MIPITDSTPSTPSPLSFFCRLDDALEWCEDRVLGAMGLGPCVPPQSVHGATFDAQNPDMNRDSDIEAPGPNPGLVIGVKAYEVKNDTFEQQQVDLISAAKRLRRVLADHLEAHADAGSDDEAVTTNESRSRSSVLSSLRSSSDAISKSNSSSISSSSSSSPKSGKSIASLLSCEHLIKFFSRVSVSAGHVLFDVGSEAKFIFFVESGVVELCSVREIDTEDSVEIETRDDDFSDSNSGGMSGNIQMAVDRVNKIGGGGIFGEAAFFLGASHSLRATALGSETSIWTLSRDDLARMEVEEPQLCLLLQHLLIKSLSISATSKLYKL